MRAVSESVLLVANICLPKCLTDFRRVVKYSLVKPYSISCLSTIRFSNLFYLNSQRCRVLSPLPYTIYDLEFWTFKCLTRPPLAIQHINNSVPLCYFPSSHVWYKMLSILVTFKHPAQLSISSLRDLDSSPPLVRESCACTWLDYISIYAHS